MSSSKGPNEPSTDRGGETHRERQRYDKPAFVREQVFETMALACGKINPTSAQCGMVKKNS